VGEVVVRNCGHGEELVGASHPAPTQLLSGHRAGAISKQLSDACHMPNWPRWMRAEIASLYVGVSRTTFLREVTAGIWPAADRRAGVVVWDRVLLDRASDKRSGLMLNGDGFDWEAAHGDQVEGHQ
jgi:hypothetical protein